MYNGGGRNWNLKACEYDTCDPYGCWKAFIGTTGAILGNLPNFDYTGWTSQALAEAAGIGTYTDIVLASQADLYGWYNDNGCNDNSGAIAYAIKNAIGSSTASSSSSSSSSSSAPVPGYIVTGSPGGAWDGCYAQAEVGWYNGGTGITPGGPGYYVYRKVGAETSQAIFSYNGSFWLVENPATYSGSCPYIYTMSGGAVPPGGFYNGCGGSASVAAGTC
jgi:hypothetical protein